MRIKTNLELIEVGVQASYLSSDLTAFSIYRSHIVCCTVVKVCRRRDGCGAGVYKNFI